jgi:hypothetical protein
VRIFFDEQERPRLLFFSWADVEGGSSEQSLRFDLAGAVVGCDGNSTGGGLPRPNLCANQSPNQKLNPDVQAVLREAHDAGPVNRDRDLLRALVPRDELSKCSTVVAP